MDEGKAVAAAAGVELGEDPWEMNVLATQRGSAHYPSMLEDVEAHRRTEIDMITGALVREAHRVGVPVPLHETMERLIKAKEDSWSIAVIGCGAVGSLFAANLATLDDVEVWAYDLAQEHVDAINRDGLRLTGAGEVTGRVRARRPTRPSCRRATSASSRRRRCTPMRRSLRPRMRSPTAASRRCRTGSATRRCSPRHVERVIRGTTFPAGKITAPGVVQWDVKGDTTLGPFEDEAGAVRAGRAARRRLHARRHADEGGRGRARPAVAQGDLQRRHQSARRAHRADARPRLRAPRPARLASQLVDEGKAVAAAQGIVLDSDPEELIDYAARPDVAYDHKASMLQDVEARRQTEVDYLNGGIAGFGKQLGVPTPTHETIWALVKGVEASWQQ